MAETILLSINIKYNYLLSFLGEATMEWKGRVLSPGDADGPMHDLQTELLASLRRKASGTLHPRRYRKLVERRLLRRRQYHVPTQLCRVWRWQAGSHSPAWQQILLAVSALPRHRQSGERAQTFTMNLTRGWYTKSGRQLHSRVHYAAVTRLLGNFLKLPNNRRVADWFDSPLSIITLL